MYISSNSDFIHQNYSCYLKLRAIADLTKSMKCRMILRIMFLGRRLTELTSDDKSSKHQDFFTVRDAGGII
jgi:hypothetical protein